MEEVKPQETTPEEGEESKIEISKKDYDELVEKGANLTQDKANLVEEIKDVRLKKKEAEEEVDRLNKEPKPLDTPKAPENLGEMTPEKLKETVAGAATVAAEAAIETARKADFVKTKDDTIEEFKNSNVDFQEDNDPGGIKYSAFERKLAMFNLSGAQSKDEILEILNSAYNLLTGKTKNPVEKNTEVPSHTPSISGGDGPKPSNPDNLSDKEKKVIRDTFDGDVQRYLKQKEKRPEYVAELLTWVK